MKWLCPRCKITMPMPYEYCGLCGRRLENVGPEAPKKTNAKVRICRVCGCTEADCRQCIQKTGEPCHWVSDDLCSACEGEVPA